MLTFLRKIRKSLIETGSARKYFLYAIGEIALVVIGILIAVQINNWNENRKTKKTERKYLIELTQALELDISDLQINIKTSQKTIQSIDILLNHFEKNLPYIDSLSIHFANSTLFTNLITDASAYEKLLARGLDIVSNDSLQSKIVNYYDFSSAFLKTNEEMVVNPHHNLSVKPAMMEKFNYSWVLKPAIPNSYETLKSDSEYLSLLKTTQEIISYQQKLSKSLIEEASSLQIDIRKELQ